MSEVATVAAITGGATVLASSVAGLVSWAMGKSSASVELARVAAENERLREANREEERRNRQSTYHQLIDVLTQLFQGLGAEQSYEEIGAICNNYTHLFAGVLLFGPSSVREGAYAVGDVYGEIWPALDQAKKQNPEKPYPERWRDATAPLEVKFGDAVSELITLMHADVTRGIADEPPT